MYNKNLRTMSTSHNLKIENYSFEELLGLFDLTYDITFEDIKRAKKKVLMMHPDKSKLPSEYFLFFKKAFDLALQYYDNITKQVRKVPKENIDYDPIALDPITITKNQLNKSIKKMGNENFQNKFNEMFEKNMVTTMDTTKNDWFKNNEPTYQQDTNVSVSNMGKLFEDMKQKNTGLIKYKGVETLNCGNSGCNLYGEDDNDGYFTCDPFSKLKYDDLRKVHKDQTVFAVSENDFNKMPQYTSTDHLNRERNIQNFLVPLEKAESERMMEMQQKEYEKNIMQKEYKSKIQSMDYANKNKIILSNFLRIDNK